MQQLVTPLLRPACLAILLFTATSGADQADAVGRWLSGNVDVWIDVRIEGNRLFGVTAGIPNIRTGEPPRLDDLNPDPALRSRSLNGLEILSGLKYAGNNKWTGGTIYNPDSGKTYRCNATLVDRNTLKLRGYIGFPLFGRSDTWTRVSD